MSRSVGGSSITERSRILKKAFIAGFTLCGMVLAQGDESISQAESEPQNISEQVVPQQAPPQQDSPPPEHPQQGYYPPPQGHPQQGYYPPPPGHPQQGYYPPQPGYYPYGYPPPLAPGDFSAGTRWATWGVNWLFPGLGSIIFMKDGWGATTQIALSATGIVIMSIGISEGIDGGGSEGAMIFYTGLGVTGVSSIYNIIRSATYKKRIKPGTPAALLERSDLNIAILPDANGKLSTYYAQYSLDF